MAAMPCPAIPPALPTAFYTVVLSRSAHKAQQKLDKPLRKLILEALNRLATDGTTIAEALKQPLEGIYSHHVKYQGREYRIAFSLEPEAQRLVVVLIGPHENFYRKLKLWLDAS